MSTAVREEANDQFAAELRAELGRQRMSQSELARRMNVDQPWLQKRLSGVIPLRIGEVYEMASLLEIPLERLFDAVKRGGKTAARRGLEFGVFRIQPLITRILPVRGYSLRAA